MNTETEDVGTNALEPTDAPIADVIETGEPAPEPEVLENSKNDEPEPAPETKQHGLKGRTPWYMERINENQNKVDRLAEELAQARRERQEAQALAERLQNGDKAPATTKTEPQDLDALIDARAEQKLFNNDCNAVASRGQNEIPGFNEKLALLRSIGVVNDDFLKDIFAVDKDNAHTILDSLSQDPEKASLMVKMDSRHRISALTRTTMAQVEKPAAPAPKAAAVSKVPAPKPVVNASSGVDEVDEEKMTDEEWSRWRKKELAKKFG